jgi:hypothetical protein
MSAFDAPINLKNWEEIHDLKMQGWIYRGQEDTSWTLETSLQRACGKWNIPLTQAREVEKSITREFRRRLHHYTGQLPSKEAHIEWLSLMQHYGAPTRLLDFSYSIYIATYFALEKATEDCLVWAIDGRWIVEKTKEKYDSPDIKRMLHDPINEEMEQEFGKILFEDPKPFVLTINPFKLNERLTIQKGVFMCTGDVTKSFEDNLKSFDGYKQRVKKFRIPKRFRLEFLQKLYDINITHATLFPGLAGFARSLSILPPILLMEGSLLNLATKTILE